MKNNLIKLCTLVLLSASILSCKKDYDPGLGPVEDSKAEIPVTVTNAQFFERYPVVTTSVAGGGNITITLAIPADKGIIKQITKVATSTPTSLNFGNLNSTNASTALNSSVPMGTTTRVVQPIMGNGTNTITFTTKLDDYLAYRIRVGVSAGVAGPQVGPPAMPGGPPTGPVTMPTPSTTATPTDIGYYFRLELADGSTITPMPVRVRILP